LWGEELVEASSKLVLDLTNATGEMEIRLVWDLVS
jgi:hypothetical protein